MRIIESLRDALFLLFLTFVLISCTSSDEQSVNSTVNLYLKNEITDASVAEFKSALESIEDNKQTIALNAVQLNSYGGTTDAAIQIGRLIREKHLNTYVAPDAHCDSACVFILIGGVQRYAFGEVGVHRLTYVSDQLSDEFIKADLAKKIQEQTDYIKAMGVSMMLADAMHTTESWRMRYLTDKEKRQWQVFGIDWLEEEMFFNQVSKERHISHRELKDIFKSNYDDCLAEAKALNKTILECINTKDQKPKSYYKRLMLWLHFKLKAIGNKDFSELSHKDQIVELETRINDGFLYRRYMNIVESDLSSIQNKSTNQLSKADVDKMEKSNVWWVTDNKISVLLDNPSNQALRTIVFELSTTDCKSDGAKRTLLFNLLVPLEAHNSVVYSAELPFDYEKVIGKGTRCGSIITVY